MSGTTGLTQQKCQQRALAWTAEGERDAAPRRLDRAEEREALSRREAMVTLDHLLAQRGMTTTPLVPAGKVQFGDELVDCVSNGELIAKGTPVVVEEVAGNRVVVRKVNP